MDLRTYQHKAIVTNRWMSTDPGIIASLFEKQQAKVWVTAEEAHLFACPLDLAHMSMGMCSELVELEEAIEARDRTNVEEELGDIMWYAVNFASMRRIQIQAQLDVGYFNYKHLVKATSTLTDLIRRITIHEGKKAPDQTVAAKLQHLVEVCYNFDFSSNYAKIDLPRALDKNIAKLHDVRFKMGYSLEAFENRDLDAERKALENDTRAPFFDQH